MTDMIKEIHQHYRIYIYNIQSGSYLNIMGPELPQTVEALNGIIATLRARGSNVPEALNAVTDAVRQSLEFKAKVHAHIRYSVYR